MCGLQDMHNLKLISLCSSHGKAALLIAEKARLLGTSWKGLPKLEFRCFLHLILGTILSKL